MKFGLITKSIELVAVMEVKRQCQRWVQQVEAKLVKVAAVHLLDVLGGGEGVRQWWGFVHSVGILQITFICTW